MEYPKVVGEWETLKEVVNGKSIARFGDGEFKIAAGGQCVSQERAPALSRELSAILVGHNPHCLVGIPTMDQAGPKYDKWARYKNIYPKQLAKGRKYYSAFISRPDSALSEVNTAEYFDLIEKLWKGKNVTLVGCGERSLTTEFLLETGANKVHHIPCPRRDAYGQIDHLEREVLKGPYERVLLCAGPTATCLADRLSKKSLYAIDLGHIGMFWRAYANPKSHLYKGQP